MLLFFTLGILAPTAFLMVLGLRSAQTESALLARDATERLGKTAQTMRAHAQEAIDARLAPFISLQKRNTAPPTHAEMQVLEKLPDRFPLYRRPGVQSFLPLVNPCRSKNC